MAAARMTALQQLFDLGNLRLAALPLLALYIYVTFFVTSDAKIPRHKLVSKNRQESKWNALREVLRQNYIRDRNSVYQVEAPHKDIVVVPSRYIEELKDDPHERLSYLADIDERFLGDYSKIIPPGGVSDKTLMLAITNGLNVNMERLTPALQQEIGHAFNETMGLCSDWTPLLPTFAFERIVARVAGLAFIGADMNCNIEYLDSMTGYVAQCVKTAASMRKYPLIFRPIAEHLDSEVQKTNAIIDKMSHLIEPLIKERADAPGEYLDMLAWSMQSCLPSQARDAEWQARYQLHIGTTSIHVTATTITHLCLDLAARPEYLKMLREEILEMTMGRVDMVMNEMMLKDLKKIDSFIKESMRLNPFSATGVSWKVLADRKLSSGLLLRRGSTVTTPVSEISVDPMIYEDPFEFDGLRFYKLRQKSGNEEIYRFDATSSEFLNWGLGQHTCPGHRFAEVLIKSIFCQFILNFDAKLPNNRTRPLNTWVDGTVLPDNSTPVLLKRHS